MVVNFAAPPRTVPATAAVIPMKAYPAELKEWEFPPLTILGDPEYQFNAQQEAMVREKAKILERTLQEYRIEAHVVEIDTGPVITMFELSVAPGIKVSQIVSLSNDIARALKAPSVRVVAPIPGKNTDRHRGAQPRQGEGAAQGADDAGRTSTGRRWPCRCSWARTRADTGW